MLDYSLNRIGMVVDYIGMVGFSVILAALAGAVVFRLAMFFPRIKPVAETAKEWSVSVAGITFLGLLVTAFVVGTASIVFALLVVIYHSIIDLFNLCCI